MNAIFRKAGPCDRSAIEELFVEMLGSIYGTENAEGYGSDNLHKFFSGGEDRIFVAEINEKSMQLGGIKIDTLVAGIEEGKRSFKITRAKPDGKSYARDIADKYGLSFESLMERAKTAKGESK